MIVRGIFILILVSVCFSGLINGQAIQPDPQSIISDIIEDVTLSSEEEVDIEALAEELLYFLDNPINLNSATYDELGKLIFLTDFQIQSLLDYVKNSGRMLSLYELQLVYGFDYDDIAKLLPFVSVGLTEEKKQQISLFSRGKHDLFIRGRGLFETPEGYTSPPQDNPGETRYAGSKLGLYTRYSYKTKSGIQIGFVGEKDPGEEFFKGSNPYGFDHFSMHAQISDVGKIKTIVLGDFNAEFGQGLTFWTGTSFGKSTDPLGIRKRGRGLNRYSSTNENLFLRGGGATIRVGKFDISVFGSYKRIDANFTDSVIDGLDVFSSMPTSGLHRTPSEIKNKKTLDEFITGGNITTSWQKLRLGVTAALINLDGYFNPQSQPYRYFEPSLSNRVNLGSDITYSLGSHLLFGEISATLNHGIGVIGGGLFRIHPLVNLSILARNYQKNYSTYYTAALADGTGPANERGAMVGIGFKPVKYWEIAGYADFFSSPWLRFGVNSPSRGQDYSLQATYSPRSNLSFNIRYRYKQKQKNEQVDSVQIDWVLPYTRQGLRVHLSYSPARAIDLKTRIEFSWYEVENQSLEGGLLLYQDISYRPSRFPLVLTARFAIFDTDSWDTRIYAYESDVLYSFSVPAYNSKGTRAYFLASYSLSKNVDLWFRVSQTYFANTTSLGSGLDLIEAPTRSDYRIQARIKF